MRDAMIRIPLICSLLTVAALIACAPANAPAHEDVLTSATTNLILPRYEALAAAMNNLNATAGTLCAAPAQSALDDVRQAWRDARAQWLRSQALWFGPVMERRSRSLVDWAPVEPDAIEERIQGGAIAPSDAREFLPSTQRGLGAIEYLLFQPDALQTLAAASARTASAGMSEILSDADSASAKAAAIANSAIAAGGASHLAPASKPTISAPATAGSSAARSDALTSGRARPPPKARALL